MKIFIRWAFTALLVTLGSTGWGQTNTFYKFAPATGVLKGSATTYVTTAAASSDIRGLWSGTCDATTFLRGDGSCVSAITAPPGSNTQIVYNNSGAFGASSLLTFNSVSDILNIGASTTPGTFSVGSLDAMVVNGVTVPIPSFAANSNIQGVFENHSYVNGVSSGGARYYGVRSEGTISSPAIVVNGDHLSTMYAAGYNGTNYSLGGDLLFLVNGTPGSSAMPTDLQVQLSPTGSQTPVTVATFGHNGGMNIGTPQSGSTALTANGVASSPTALFQSSTTTGSGQGVSIQAGTNTSDFAWLVKNAAGSTTFSQIFGDGGMVMNGATGGDKGLGTINAVGLYVGGVAVGTGGGTPGGSTGQIQYNNGGVFGGSPMTYTSASGDFSIPAQTSGNAFTVSGIANNNTINTNGVPNISMDGTTPEFNFGGQNAGSAFLMMQRYSAAAGGGDLQFYHSRGASIGTQTILSSGDEIGSLSFSGSDGTTTSAKAARIIGFADGTWTAASSTPGRIEFYTVPSGSTSLSQRMVLGNGGGLTINTPTSGDAVNASGSIKSVASASANLGSSGMGLFGGSPAILWQNNAGTTDTKIWDCNANSSTDLVCRAVNDAFSSANSWIDVNRTGTTINSVTFANGGLVAGTPTGGSKGTGSLNAQNLYVNGTSVVVSGTFTATITGMNSTVTGTMNYTAIVGKTCTLWPQGPILGTSNAVTMTITGIPAACTPASSNAVMFGDTVTDNGITAYVGVAEVASNSTIILGILENGTSRPQLNNNGWTPSGTKGINSDFSITFHL